jgi:hypothetical protein
LCVLIVRSRSIIGAFVEKRIVFPYLSLQVISEKFLRLKKKKN